MTGLNKQEPLLLIIGDIVIFAVTLWVSLLMRYSRLPDIELLKNHAMAFAPLLVIWLTVFFIAGLYERHTIILRQRLPKIIISAQIFNGAVAVAFFYFASYLTIAPKTILFLYVVLSSIGVIAWRLYGYPLVGSREKQNAFLIGEGDEIKELEEEVNNNDFYPMRFASSIDVSKLSGLNIENDLIKPIYEDNVMIVALDTSNDKVAPLLPHLYNLMFSNVRFISLHKLYGEIFKRVPLSLVRYDWFLENISNQSKPVFDAVKRIIDVLVAFILGGISLVLYPFVILALKIEDGGPIFSVQKRIGQNNKVVSLVKFRTMLFNDEGNWRAEGRENRVTKVGRFLRRTRIDELPQLWNVLKGDASLIGPRPEFPDPVKHYVAEIPFYNVRHLIKPGLSGWAQLYGEHPHHGVDVSMTANKLAYDLYYLNNRSILLDLEIALKTLRILLTFKGK